MSFKLALALQIVLVGTAFAEQQKAEVQGYPPAGWRPSGPVFHLPTWSRLPRVYGVPPTNQLDPTEGGNLETSTPAVEYGAPSVRQDKELKVARNASDNQEGTTEAVESLTTTVEPSVDYGPPPPPKILRQDKKLYKIGLSYLPAKEPVEKTQEETINANNFQRVTKPSFEYGVPISRRGKEFEGVRKIDYERQPQDTLAAPPNEPAITYGPPEAETTTETETTTTEEALPTTTEAVETAEETEAVETAEETGARAENLTAESSAAEEEGTYYIYHPSGLLQKVSYKTKDDASKMAYSAQLKYENIEPIRNPVYTYDPETLVFRRLY